MRRPATPPPSSLTSAAALATERPSRAPARSRRARMAALACPTTLAADSPASSPPPSPPRERAPGSTPRSGRCPSPLQTPPPPPPSLPPTASSTPPSPMYAPATPPSTNRFVTGSTAPHAPPTTRTSSAASSFRPSPPCWVTPTAHLPRASHSTRCRLSSTKRRVAGRQGRVRLLRFTKRRRHRAAPGGHLPHQPLAGGLGSLAAPPA